MRNNEIQIGGEDDYKWLYPIRCDRTNYKKMKIEKYRIVRF